MEMEADTAVAAKNMRSFIMQCKVLIYSGGEIRL